VEIKFKSEERKRKEDSAKLNFFLKYINKKMDFANRHRYRKRCRQTSSKSSQSTQSFSDTISVSSSESSSGSFSVSSKEEDVSDVSLSVSLGTFPCSRDNCRTFGEFSSNFKVEVNLPSNDTPNVLPTITPINMTGFVPRLECLPLHCFDINCSKGQFGSEFFNMVTGTFTAPVDGKYEVKALVNFCQLTLEFLFSSGGITLNNISLSELQRRLSELNSTVLFLFQGALATVLGKLADGVCPGIALIKNCGSTEKCAIEVVRSEVSLLSLISCEDTTVSLVACVYLKAGDTLNLAVNWVTNLVPLLVEAGNTTFCVRLLEKISH